MSHTQASIVRDKKLPEIEKSAGDVAHLSSRLPELHKRLETLSAELIKFIAKAEDKESEEARKLWHDLNGLEHLIEQFTFHAETALGEFKQHSSSLIVSLQKLRKK